MHGLTLLVAAVIFAGPASLQAGADWDRWDGDDGVRILVGRSHQVPPGSTQAEPLLVIGGSVGIDGTVEDDVLVVGGDLRIGPTAIVRGDLTTVGGTITIDPQARVEGSVSEAAIGPLFGLDVPSDRRWWAVFGLALTIARFVLLLLVAAAVALAAPRWTREVGEDAANAPFATLLTGWAAQILFLPGVVVITVALAFSLVGIPLVGLVPFLVLASIVVWAAGFAATAARLGRALRGRGRSAADPTAADAMVGVWAVGVLTFAGHLMALGPMWLMPVAIVTLVCGLAVEYLAWSVGLGAAARVLVSRLRGGPLPRATLQPAQ